MKDQPPGALRHPDIVSRDVLPPSWSVVKTAGRTPGGDNFLPLAVANLPSGQQLPFNVYLKTRVAGADQIKYLIYCHKNDTFTPALVDKLMQSGVAWVYVHLREHKAVVYYLYHNLRHFLDDDRLPPPRKVERIYDVSLLWLREFFHTHKSRLGDRLTMGLDLVKKLINYIFQEPSYQEWFLDICRHDSRLYSHCLNCCVLGLAFAKYLGWSPFKIRDFGLGALVHDIGMLKVPARVRDKPGNLTPEEQEVVRRHPVTGFALLKEYSSLSRESLAVVLQHHEHRDGSGYPQGLKLSLIDPVGRVMRIIDAYEALTSPRSWRPRLEPVAALRIMRQEWQESGIFDANYLSVFIRFLARN